MNSIDDYLAAPYSYRIFFSQAEDEEGAWIAEVVEIPSCISFGSSPEESLAMVREALKGIVMSRLERGVDIPLPAALSRSA